MRGISKPAHVRADLGEDYVSSGGTDTRSIGEVDPSETVNLTPEAKSRIIQPPFSIIGIGRACSGGLPVLCIVLVASPAWVRDDVSRSVVGRRGRPAGTVVPIRRLIERNRCHGRKAQRALYKRTVAERVVVGVLLAPTAARVRANRI